MANWKHLLKKAAKNLLPVLEGLKNCKITGETVTIKSSGNDATRLGIEALAQFVDAFTLSVKKRERK